MSALASHLRFSNSEKPIKVLKKMGDVKCRTGGKAEFACEIDDPDQKNVKWFKDGKEIKVYILFRYLYIK